MGLINGSMHLRGEQALPDLQKEVRSLVEENEMLHKVKEKFAVYKYKYKYRYISCLFWFQLIGVYCDFWLFFNTLLFNETGGWGFAQSLRRSVGREPNATGDPLLPPIHAQ